MPCTEGGNNANRPVSLKRSHGNINEETGLFSFIRLLICLIVCDIFFLTNTHGLQVLLGPFLLLASYSQLLPHHVSSVFGLEIKGSFYHTSKQKEKSNLQTNSPLELSKLPSVSQPQAMDEDAYC